MGKRGPAFLYIVWKCTHPVMQIYFVAVLEFSILSKVGNVELWTVVK